MLCPKDRCVSRAADVCCPLVPARCGATPQIVSPQILLRFKVFQSQKWSGSYDFTKDRARWDARPHGFAIKCISNKTIS